MGDFERSGRLGVSGGGGSMSSFCGCCGGANAGASAGDGTIVSSDMLRSTLSSLDSGDFLSLIRSSTRLLGEVGLGGTLSFGDSCGSVGEHRSITVVTVAVVVGDADFSVAG